MTGNTTSHRGKQPNTVEAATISALPLLPAQIEDLHIPFSNQAAFWRPRHAAASPMLGHVPFLFWLMGTVRPRIVMQSDIGDGVVYMALCQAADRLGDSVMCLGIQANEPLIPPAMLEQHDTHYSDFSELFHGSLINAAQRFNGEIDLLVLNKAIDGHAMESLQNDLLPRLSDRAVILLCNPEDVFPDISVRNVLLPKQTKPIVIDPVSAGGQKIEVVLYGKHQSERLNLLADQHPGKPTYLATRQAFSRLGQGVEAIQKVEDLRKERDHLNRLFQSAQAALEQHEKELAAKSAEANAARASEAVEVSRQAEVLGRLYDLGRELSEKEREAADLATERSRLEARIMDVEILSTAQIANLEAEKAAHRVAFDKQLEELKAEMATLAADKTALKQELAEARNAHEERIHDIVVLTKAYEKERQSPQLMQKQATSQILQMEERIASIHRAAGVEIGRVVMALLPKDKGPFGRRVCRLWIRRRYLSQTRS
ncbi:hypothetical protein [Ensifer canadensis]|uniref:hypothetical protein n=1 Tax=Ensifer canadensis TaxID=555315 RepID=UPI0035E3EAAF